MQWVWRHPGIRTLGLLTAALQTAISGVSLVVIVTARNDHAAPATLGVVLAAVGIGGVIGASLAPRLERRLGLRRLLLTVVWGQGALWLGFALAPNLVVISAALLLFAMTMPLFGVAVLTYQLAATPSDLRGRVSTTFGLMTWGATPIGAALAGLLLSTVSPTTTALCFAALVFIIAVLASTLPGLRHLHRPSTQAADASTK